MDANMMNMPLTITSIMRHAQQVFGETEVISVNLDLSYNRYCYRDCFKRAGQLALALVQCGLKQGDRVATLAWNDYHHLEAYYAISCAGAVCHTINPRLHLEQVNQIIADAQDKFLIISGDLYAALGSRLLSNASFEKVIVYEIDANRLSDESVEYEAFIATGKEQDFRWPELDENQAAGLCYTSGTTGNPKGALYSHRSTVLHSYAMSLPDALNISSQDRIMPIVPMFHVNAWGIPYAAPMTGCSMVLPGRYMGDGKVLAKLIDELKVTLAAGVPTAWNNLMDQFEETMDGIKRLSSLKMAAIGGAAAPEKLVQDIEACGPEVRVAWGMTETSPLGCVNVGSDARELSSKVKAGRPVFGIEFRIVDDQGQELDWNGITPGNLEVKGNWVCSRYYKKDSDNWDNEGWFNTGDIAKIDQNAYISITDRSKDLIKSGGEWISSIDLENIAASHPDVREAAVIAIPDEKWDERPALYLVPQSDREINTKGILDFYEGKVAKWWVPDQVIIIDELPHTATGKVDKKALRKINKA